MKAWINIYIQDKDAQRSLISGSRHYMRDGEPNASEYMFEMRRFIYTGDE